MAGDYPIQSENSRDLWFKVAQNFYQFALLRGAVDIDPPIWNESVTDLAYKATYCAAKIIG